jgi:MbtH protein
MHDDDRGTYRVAVGPQEQYSLWPADAELPPGWRGCGRAGSKDECVAYLAEVWTAAAPMPLPRRAG